MPSEIVVSDDGVHTDQTEMACRQFPRVRYFVGPRRGLSANRNSVVKNAKMEYVSLLDDDALVSERFVENCAELISRGEIKVVYTGPIRERGALIFPTNSTFLGFFGKRPKGVLENINLNCNLFPRSSFKTCKFDEVITYGYEDVDVCNQLRADGFRIVFVLDLLNEHAPPQRSELAARAFARYADQARFYVMVKRHLIWQRSYARLFAYVFFAPLHQTVALLKQRRWREAFRPIFDMGFAIRKAVGVRHDHARNV